MYQVLLINNEIGPGNVGPIQRAAEYGLPAGTENITNLSSFFTSLGCNVTVIHHTLLNSISIQEFDCIVLSGFFPGRGYTDEELFEEFADEIQFIRNSHRPILGICLGIQLIGLAFGAITKPLSDSRGEHGIIELYIKGSHPLIDQPDGAIEIRCLGMHGRELAAVPDDFELLLSSNRCAIQMIAHRKRPIIGVQFHPELLLSGVDLSGPQLVNKFLSNMLHN